MSESSATAAPLLRPRQGPESDNSGRMPQTTALALLLGRAAGRRGPSMMVRETAARELEERRADWGYSKPVVALDIVWNMAFVVVSLVMLVCTVNERCNVPIRVWICGYALQCLVHVVLVWLEYRRRILSRRESVSGRGRGRGHGHGVDFDSGGFGRGFEFDRNDSDGDDDAGFVMFGSSYGSSFAKKCESVNTMASFLWWIVGFYWVVSGGEVLLHDAPRLYWLTVVYLAFDVFFAIFCVVLACLIGIALCCCLPCIIAILYTVSGQEGASEAELNMLPKYRFRSSSDDKPGVGAGVMVPVENVSGYLAMERVLLPEDANPHQQGDEKACAVPTTSHPPASIPRNAVSVSVHMMMEQSSMLFLATITSMQHALSSGLR